MKSSSFSLQKSIFLSIITLILLSAILSACDYDFKIGTVETDITVFRNTYKMKMIISFTQDELEWIGGPDAFKALLNEQLPDSNQDGSYVTWREITSGDSEYYRYEITTKRTDYNQAHTAGFNWQEIRFNSRKAYKFDYSELYNVLGGFSKYTITLHAGKILGTNGIKLDNRTVIWVNPDTEPYAIVIPKNSTIGFFLILGLGLIVFVGFFVFLTFAVLGIVLTKKKENSLTEPENVTTDQL